MLHVREARPSRGADAVAALAAVADEIDDVSALHGSGVLELFVRHGDKGSTVTDLRAEVSAATTVLARRRLRDPDAVQTLLAAIAEGVSSA